MDIRKLQRAIVDGLEDVKAQDIVVFNTEELSALFERVIIASGTSNRQTKALAASVRDKVNNELRDLGARVIGTEGLENGEWIIVDCGQAVVHIMQPAIRQYYHLEEIWGGKPVTMKLGAVRGLVKAEAADEDDEPAAKPAKRARPTKADAAEAAARREAAAKSAGKPAGKAPARKRAAAVVDEPVARKAPARKTSAAGDSAARKPAAKKSSTGRKAPVEVISQVVKVRASKTATDSAAKLAADRNAAKKATARRAAPRKTAAAAPAAKPAARQAAPEPARKAPVRKTAAPKGPVRKVAAPKAAVKTTSARAPASKPAPAKPAGKSAAARKKTLS
ncbi:MAG: ribosome silencing factor [Burkholderiales bacterium]|nr:ribosome silencing factor [Burkholderiales bacterium]